MAHWKFITTLQTEKECYIRRLFASKSDTIEKTGEKISVEDGDTLYLHQLGGEDYPGWITGPFIADGDAAEEIDPDAWSHRANFYWQVRFDWDETVHTIKVPDITDREGNTPIEIKSRPQSFDDVAGTYLSGVLRRKGIPVISN